ncbi:putative pat-1 homologue [Clavibacter sepedonicus]|uniref:Pat-1 homologue n=1 Tax=Clavibacter sepedonicus TaxID=31964 RepID=B0RFV8_CLASE|nr:putative pat-1 homologue [Clavibacter sepedonicus]
MRGATHDRDVARPPRAGAGSRWWRAVRGRASSLIAVAVVVIASLTVAAPARAVDFEARSETPIRAGSVITFYGGSGSGFAHPVDHHCTAGPVLVARGIISNFTEYLRAVRYVTIPVHCGVQGQKAYAGDVEIGAVSWESPDADLAVVRVEPSAVRVSQCYHTSSGPRCTIVTHYTPRAVGEVFVAVNRRGQELPLRVAGAKVPSDREVFCSSGMVTGVKCTWTTTPEPPGWRPTGPHELIARTSGGNVLNGDSGAPVVSQDAKIIGMVVGSGDDDGPYRTFMTYIPISYILQERSAFALATS